MRAKIAELEAKPFLTPQQQAQLDKLNAQESAASAPKDPNFLEDPKGYVDTKLAKTEENLKKLSESDQKREQERQQQQQFQQLMSTVQHHESEFVKQTPDYHEALNHARTVRTTQLKMMFPQANENDIRAQIYREEVGSAAQVLQAGMNPAEFAYNYAKTLGYAPKAAAAASGVNAQAPNGAATSKDAVRTLGNGGGAEQAEEPADDELGSALNSALAERFGLKKRK